ncbi:hypothetical protein N657DRAFT_278525 [Parathielavia appendiculata]|uniref:Uncharacterized protein n=1 Tax=Parathielavia appendiculata TaxID=2587402 RepID=A0AAN6U4P4_9PEZI|nr:hypothetical protein N657DRAFT_278525 [Parathielavia appendiculata]
MGVRFDPRTTFQVSSKLWPRAFKRQLLAGTSSNRRTTTAFGGQTGRVVCVRLRVREKKVDSPKNPLLPLNTSTRVFLLLNSHFSIGRVTSLSLTPGYTLLCVYFYPIGNTPAVCLT